MAPEKYGRGKNPNSRKTQIKAGEQRSRGRPKGAPNRNNIIRKVLGQVVVGDVDGRKKKVSVTEASLLRLAQAALQGDLKAIREVLALWKESEESIAAARDSEYPYGDADKEVISALYARMQASRPPT